MLKEVIKYTDYNDIEREDTFYFHISKPEMIAMQVSNPIGLDKYLEKIVINNDKNTMLKVFADMILKSVGEKTQGGGFRKTEDITKAFEESRAYEVLLMDLLMNEDRSLAFFRGIIPVQDVDKAELKKLSK